MCHHCFIYHPFCLNFNNTKKDELCMIFTQFFFLHLFLHRFFLLILMAKRFFYNIFKPTKHKINVSLNDLIIYITCWKIRSDIFLSFFLSLYLFSLLLACLFFFVHPFKVVYNFCRIQLSRLWIQFIIIFYWCMMWCCGRGNVT